MIAWRSEHSVGVLLSPVIVEKYDPGAFGLPGADGVKTAVSLVVFTWITVAAADEAHQHADITAPVTAAIKSRDSRPL